MADLNARDVLDHLDTSRKGAVIMVVTTRTPIDLNKKHRETKEPCPYADGIYRIAKRSVVAGASYETRVNKVNQEDALKQAEKDGWDITDPGTVQAICDEVPEFNADQLWRGNGYHIEGSRFLVGHKKKDTVYLFAMPKTVEGKPGRVVVIEDGIYNGTTHELLSKSEIDELKHYTGKPSPPNKQTWRCFKLENVAAITCGKTWQFFEPKRKAA